jgi:CubicO group peptidase (beta-lactamase class C family)
MKRRDSLTLLLAGLCSPVVLRAAAPKIEAMEAAAQLIQMQVESGVLESAVLLMRRGNDSFQRVFGKAGSAEAMFLLGSITKPMTATAVMVLADRGELRLADPVMKYIPEFSEGARKEVTIQHLLTHTSGLPDQLPDNNALRQRHASLEEFVQEVVRTPLLFTPGTKYHYQSMGILLAAEVARRITKTALPGFLAKEVFTPLGMKHSALGLGSFKLAEMVRCQTEHAAPESGAGAADAKDWDWNSPWWRGYGAPWGGAHCSAADVTRFLRSFLHPDGTVLREETARLMIEDHTPGLEAHRGIGFAVGPHGLGTGCSEKTFGHSGSTGALAWADPRTDMSCVILTSLPLQVSGGLFLHAVSDAVSSAA